MRSLTLLILVLLPFVPAPLAANPWQGFMSITLSPDGRFFATGGRSGEVMWYDTVTGEVLDRWLGAGLPVVGLDFAESNTGLGEATLDGTKAWLVRGKGISDSFPPGVDLSAPLIQAVNQWIASPPALVGVRISAGGLWAQGTPDGQITVGTVAGGAPLATWHAHDAAVTGLALALDGSFLLSCGYDGTLGRWNPKTGQSLGHL